MTLVLRILTLTLFAWSDLALDAGTTWPRFRGPNGAGVAEADSPPIAFGPGTNIIFKVAVPPGLSSAVVWNDRIFITAFEEGKLVTLCYHAHEGKLLWRREAPFEKLEAFHPTEGSPAASTPATDGQRVYSYFGSGGVFAYSLEGEEVWARRLPVAEHVGDFGTGTSPVVHGGLLFINRDMLHGAHLLALHAGSGEIAWRTERPDMLSSWTTPIMREHNGRAELILAGGQKIKGYSPSNGEEIWSFHGLPNATCPMPVLGEGMLFFAGWSPTSRDVQLGSFPTLLQRYDKNGDRVISSDEVSGGALGVMFKAFDSNSDGQLAEKEWEQRMEQMERAVNQAFALRPGAGRLGEKNVAWTYTRGLPYVPTSLYYRGKFYMVRDGGMVTCLDAKSGEPDYEQERVGALGSYYPSPVAADGRIYICSNDGKFTVFAAGEKPEVLARADLGERCMTTAAIAHNRLYVRSATQFWCFGER